MALNSQSRHRNPENPDKKTSTTTNVPTKTTNSTKGICTIKKNEQILQIQARLSTSDYRNKRDLPYGIMGYRSQTVSALRMAFEGVSTSADANNKNKCQKENNEINNKENIDCRINGVTTVVNGGRRMARKENLRDDSSKNESIYERRLAPNSSRVNRTNSNLRRTSSAASSSSIYSTSPRVVVGLKNRRRSSMQRRRADVSLIIQRQTVAQLAKKFNNLDTNSKTSAVTAKNTTSVSAIKNKTKCDKDFSMKLKVDKRDNCEHSNLGTRTTNNKRVDKEIVQILPAKEKPNQLAFSTWSQSLLTSDISQSVLNVTNNMADEEEHSDKVDSVKVPLNDASRCSDSVKDKNTFSSSMPNLSFLHRSATTRNLCDTSASTKTLSAETLPCANSNNSECDLTKTKRPVPQPRLSLLSPIKASPPTYANEAVLEIVSQQGSVISANNSFLWGNSRRTATMLPSPTSAMLPEQLFALAIEDMSSMVDYTEDIDNDYEEVRPHSASHSYLQVDGDDNSITYNIQNGYEELLPTPTEEHSDDRVPRSLPPTPISMSDAYEQLGSHNMNDSDGDGEKIYETAESPYAAASYAIRTATMSSLESNKESFSGSWEDLPEIVSNCEEVNNKPKLRPRLNRTRSRRRRVTRRATNRSVSSLYFRNRRSANSGSHNGEDDTEISSSSHHYEALYETVQPPLPSFGPSALPPVSAMGGTVDSESTWEDSFDDSFDSDASEEIINPLYHRQSSSSSVPSTTGATNALGKWAEAAGRQMQKLSRKLSVSKGDLKLELPRLRRKSAPIVHDTSNGNVTLTSPPTPPAPNYPPPPLPLTLPPSSTSQGKPPLTSPSVSAPTTTSRARKKSWSLKRPFRRKSEITPPPATSTFYLGRSDSDSSRSATLERRESEIKHRIPQIIPKQRLPSTIGTSAGRKLANNVSPSTTMNRNSPPNSGTYSNGVSSTYGMQRPKEPPPAPPATLQLRECSISSHYGMNNGNRTIQYADIDVGRRKSNSSTKSNSPTSPTSPPLNSTPNNYSSSTYPLPPKLPPENGKILNYNNGTSDMYKRLPSTLFHEPLYQFYTEEIQQRFYRDDGEECWSSSEEGYEEISDIIPLDSDIPNNTCVNSSTESNYYGGSIISSGRSAMDLITGSGPRCLTRSLWSELPEVVASGLLDRLTPSQKKLQEAFFEVMTSEASYLKSLQVLEDNFVNSSLLADETCLTARERQVLFGDIPAVKSCAVDFLFDLERRWTESLYIRRLCDVILDHAPYFGVYVKYCSNQVHRDRLLAKLRDSRPTFADALRRAESAPAVHSLSLGSFLLLPAQRATRLPLLMDAVLRRLPPGDELEDCQRALAALHKVASECNEGARRMERLEELLVLSQKLDFREVSSVAIVSGGRYLVRRGDVTKLQWKEEGGRRTFGRRLSRLRLHLFLFSDLLVVARSKGDRDDSFLVVDHCARNMIQLTEMDSDNKSKLGSIPNNNTPATNAALGRLGKFPADCHHIMLLTLLQNHERKTMDFVLACSLASERTRWVEALTPSHSEDGECIYEEWDLPQVRATHIYSPREADELALTPGDVINVRKKLDDGWFLGERLPDGERGWFPANHCVEIASAHVRARNLRQRHRLLALSASFLRQQQKRRL